MDRLLNSHYNTNNNTNGAGGGGSSGVNNNTIGGINSTNSKDAQGSRGHGLNAELQRFATLTEEAALMRSLPRGDFFYEREREQI